MLNVFYNSCKCRTQLSIKELEILQEGLTKSKVYCSCGHSIVMPLGKDKTICSWCGSYVFRNKKEEFKYRLYSKLSQ